MSTGVNVEKVNKLRQELMDYISVIWEIGFEEVKEIKLKN